MSVAHPQPQAAAPGVGAIAFGGHALRALEDGALYWPAREALIVADLHLEKASAFARHGQFLPPYDSAATLAGIERALRRTAARSIWCLGDSFHDRGGPDRLDEATREALMALTARVEWIWLAGNHDGLSPAALGGRVCDEAMVEGLVLRHEARAGEVRPEISGHYHPKYRVVVRGRAVSRRCFLLAGNRLILPAYGRLAGGMDVRASAFAPLTGGRGEALIPLHDRLLRFPLA